MVINCNVPSTNVILFPFAPALIVPPETKPRAADLNQRIGDQLRRHTNDLPPELAVDDGAEASWPEDRILCVWN